MGKREIEDSLGRLDKLTQEETWMASAEQLKIVNGVDDRVRSVGGQVKDVREDFQDVRGYVQYVGNKVQSVEARVQDLHGELRGVRGDVQCVRSDVQDVGNKVRDVEDKVLGISANIQGVDDKLVQANRSSFLNPDCCSAGSNNFTGNQFKDSLLRWLSPPSPSTNHNIACKAHHNGTTQWFFRGSFFSQWKSTGSFLWVHGKRVLLLILDMRRPLIVPFFYSRFRKKRFLVSPSPTIYTLARDNIVISVPQ